MRRFGPLFAVLVLTTLALLARLWDVQVVQHDVWAAESVNLVRSHSVEPYVRGAIRDRHGRLIAHDEEVYTLDFVWREFRRGHPLGQVAMMRSLAKMSPVGLDETSQDLEDLAVEYASLSPAALVEFGEGEALKLRGTDEYVPGIAADDDGERKTLARRENRPTRAGDISFYILRLLDLSRLEQRRVRDLIEKEGGEERSFLDLAGEATRRETAEVEKNLRDRVDSARARLARLAELIEFDEDDSGAPGQEPTSKEKRLFEIIEERRREVDDDSADQLFRIAAGFSPRRLSKENLRRFELDWLAAALDWNDERLEHWQESRPAIFKEEALAGTGLGRHTPREVAGEPRGDLQEGGAGSDDKPHHWMANHAIARSKIVPGGAERDRGPADRLLSAIAHTFRAESDAWARKNAAPENWREVAELEVLATLHDRLVVEGSIEDACRAPVFRFQSPEVRSSPEGGEKLLEKMLEEVRLDEEESVEPIELANTWRRDWDEDDRDLVSEVLSRMNTKLQARIAEVLSLAAGDRAQVQLEEVHVEKARETRRYVVRDRGARSRTIGKEPSIDVVLLVTRYPKAFAGFRATPRTERVLDAMGPDGVTPLASRLIGKVRSPYLVDVLADRPELERLATLRRKLELPEDDREQILRLIDDSYRPGERVGASGLEAWLDEELRGKNGVFEEQGLQDRVAGNRDPIYRGAEDGQDVVLTLDVGLQRAAESVLMAPVYPTKDTRADPEWFERPVGAIVLATVEGEILAAASWPAVPDKRDDEVARRRDGEQKNARERTLGRATGMSPGSVVKPLMAAYALQFLGLDRSRSYVCDADEPRLGAKAEEKRESNRWLHAGWGKVNCNSRLGHSRKYGRINMRDALCYSCNVYFAGIAEELFDPGHMMKAYETFGFGRETGVRWSDDGTRFGLRDDHGVGDARFKDPGPETRQFLGNGLTYINATPVQVARAYAGLATGHLPTMTLVREVKGEEIPRTTTALPISKENLDLVRGAVRQVLKDPGSSAHGKGLSASAEDLGFEFTCKTGSADYRAEKVLRNGVEREVQRKHTWVSGWFPHEDPRYVLTVLCHDTTATASHSAVYVAAQFLKTEAVKELMGVKAQ